MLARIKRFLARKPPKSEFSAEDYDRHYELKHQWLESLLGPMHHMVGHAIIPYAVGGAVDMYYFPQVAGGTAFATMELIEPDGSGPRPSSIGTYELAAFTRHQWSTSADDPFNRIERRFCGIFTTIGRYSTDAVLNPGETCEVPASDEGPNRCVVFDHLSKPGVDFRTDSTRHGLLLCLEVLPIELEFARSYGSNALLARLKEAGHYPFSDLDRQPVA